MKDHPRPGCWPSTSPTCSPSTARNPEGSEADVRPTIHQSCNSFLWSKTMDFLFVIPLVVMIAPVLIVLTVLRYRYQQSQARYQTLLQLADKGAELPAQLLLEPHAAYCERRRALVLIGSGL